MCSIDGLMIHVRVPVLASGPWHPAPATRWEFLPPKTVELLLKLLDPNLCIKSNHDSQLSTSNPPVFHLQSPIIECDCSSLLIVPKLQPRPNHPVWKIRDLAVLPLPPLVTHQFQMIHDMIVWWNYNGNHWNHWPFVLSNDSLAICLLKWFIGHLSYQMIHL